MPSPKNPIPNKLPIPESNPYSWDIAVTGREDIIIAEMYNEIKAMRKEVQELKRAFELFAGDHIFINGKLIQLKDIRCL